MHACTRARVHIHTPANTDTHTYKHTYVTHVTQTPLPPPPHLPSPDRTCSPYRHDILRNTDTTSTRTSKNFPVLTQSKCNRNYKHRGLGDVIYHRDTLLWRIEACTCMFSTESDVAFTMGLCFERPGFKRCAPWPVCYGHCLVTLFSTTVTTVTSWLIRNRGKLGGGGGGALRRCQEVDVGAGHVSR